VTRYPPNVLHKEKVTGILFFLLQEWAKNNEIRKKFTDVSFKDDLLIKM